MRTLKQHLNESLNMGGGLNEAKTIGNSEFKNFKELYNYVSSNYETSSPMNLNSGDLTWIHVHSDWHLTIKYDRTKNELSYAVNNDGVPGKRIKFTTKKELDKILSKTK